MRLNFVQRVNGDRSTILPISAPEKSKTLDSIAFELWISPCNSALLASLKKTFEKSKLEFARAQSHYFVGVAREYHCNG
jgi:hypothetical protein